MNKIAFWSVLSLMAVGCTESKFPGFEQTESGLYHNITRSDNPGRSVGLDDILTIEMTYGSDDSVLFDSKKMDFPTQLRLGSPAYNGDVMEGFGMLNVGDEAEFKTSADSFFTVIAGTGLPHFIDSGSFLTFNVKLLNAQTLEELTAEREAEAEINEVKEIELMEKYITENDITVEPKESGLYFIETAPGSGASAERGSTVKVHYMGRLLTGEKFDSSYDRGEPIEFKLGTGMVIPGWDEGIGYMTVGSKATLIIPSILAYGDRPPPGGMIKPYSPLVFDVELVEVN